MDFINVKFSNFLKHEDKDAIADTVINLMNRFSLKEGIDKLGEHVEQAAKAELEQQHFGDSFAPNSHEDITHAQCKAITDGTMSIEEKTDGRIKGRNAASGSVQQEQSIKKTMQVQKQNWNQCH